VITEPYLGKFLRVHCHSTDALNNDSVDDQLPLASHLNHPYPTHGIFHGPNGYFHSLPLTRIGDAHLHLAGGSSDG